MAIVAAQHGGCPVGRARWHAREHAPFDRSSTAAAGGKRHVPGSPTEHSRSTLRCRLLLLAEAVHGSAEPTVVRQYLELAVTFCVTAVGRRMDKQENLGNFVAITSSNEADALQYLEVRRAVETRALLLRLLLLRLLLLRAF